MHMFAYLNSHERSKVALDPGFLNHREQAMPDWTDFYKGSRMMLRSPEEKLSSAPVSLILITQVTR